MAAKDNDDRKERDQDDGSLDMSQAAVKKMIADARERGYITYDQLNAVLPPDQVSSDQIEDVMSMLSEMGIQVTEEEESEETDQGLGLCESPLTFQAITIWRDELLNEDILLRDVIDLETTFGNTMGEDGEEEVAVVQPGAAPAAKPAEGEAAQELDADGNPIAKDDDDDDDDQANMSLAAMEAALKPRVLETLEIIARDFAMLSDMQDARMSATLNEDSSFSAKEEQKYQALRAEIVEMVNSLHLHNNRIEALIDQLYGINRRIMQIDSSMVKLADQARINRREFIEAYRGRELDPNWLEEMGEKTGPSGQERNGRSEPASGDLDCEEVHEPWPAIP